MPVIKVNTTNLVIRVSPTSAKVIRTAQVARIIAVARQGPVGPQGPIGLPGIGGQIDTFGIGTGTTTVATLVLTGFCAAKWLILVDDPTNSLKRWSEIGAMKSPTSGLTHTIYGTLGDTMPYTLDVVEVSGSVELQLTNVGADALDARVIQLPVTV